MSEFFGPWYLFKLRAKQLLTPARLRPVLGDHPYGGPEGSSHTFVISCSAGFDVSVPNAAATYRLGLARGFAAAGIRYRLVSAMDLARVLPELQKPFVLLSSYDYLYMNARARRALRDVPHFVWVNPSFPGLPALYAQHGLPDPRPPAWLAKRVFDSGPAFVFAPVPTSCLRFYEDWAIGGARVESVLQACDDTRYGPGPVHPKFKDVKLGYVGGYWKYKNIQYEKYLRPYESSLTVYGYSQWPYSGYAGRLSDDEEQHLYRSAMVCPALSEPHAEVMGDIVERVFKILGCRGLAITDVVPAYAEVFGRDELLVPASIDEYHEMVKRALSDEDFRNRYRDNGYRAVEQGHRYVHRAAQILSLLGLDATRPAAAAVTRLQA
jgi:hypothetical protein